MPKHVIRRQVVLMWLTVIVLTCLTLLVCPSPSAAADTFGPFGSGGAVYVINLDRHTDRLAAFQRRFEASDVSGALGPVRRVPAVDGKAIEYDRVVAPTAMPKLRDVISTGARRDHHELTPGAVGCYLSHMLAWQTLANSGEEWALIFEDDANIPRDMWQRTVGMLRDVPSGWDIILLGWEGEHSKVQGTSSVVRIRRFCCLHAYIISRMAARRLLQANMLPMSQQIDWELSARTTGPTGLNIYGAETSIVTVAPGFGTSIQTPFR